MNTTKVWNFPIIEHVFQAEVLPFIENQQAIIEYFPTLQQTQYKVAGKDIPIFSPSTTNISFRDRYRTNDDDLKLLCNLSRLEYLDLSMCYNITDKGLEYVSRCPRLKTLILNWCNEITDDGLAHLDKLTRVSTVGCIKLSLYASQS